MSEVRRARIVRCTATGEAIEASDELAVEEPLEIRVADTPVSITMRSPGEDLELVAGFLLSEGMLAPGAVPFIRHQQPNVANVAAEGVRIDAMERLRRNIFLSSSCGLCGKATIAAVHQAFERVTADLRIAPAVIARLSDALGAEQRRFARTGGLHAAALFTAEGELLVVREDVGRHNAVDKVIGHALLKRWLPLDRHILMVSGRTSFEILQKSLSARVPVVAAVSAPSSLAVEFAVESGQTLIGFLRDGRWNVYSGEERVA